MNAGTSIVGQQVWIGRPGRRYHDHALLYPGPGAPVPFLVHRHTGGEVAHGHRHVESGPGGALHATDVDDVTPFEDLAASAAERYPLEEFARDMRVLRERQAEMDAAL